MAMGGVEMGGIPGLVTLKLRGALGDVVALVRRWAWSRLPTA